MLRIRDQNYKSHADLAIVLRSENAQHARDYGERTHGEDQPKGNGEHVDAPSQISSQGVPERGGVDVEGHPEVDGACELEVRG